MCAQGGCVANVKRKLLYVVCFLCLCVLTCASFAPLSRASDILLDPGHSPGKPGAESCSGQYEFVYNENLVRTIVNYLAERNIDVDCTRDPGAELSLHKRAAKARGKRFFLSIHHDSAQPKYLRNVNGHPCTTRSIRGYSLFVSGKNAHFEQSLMYARVLGEVLNSMGFVPSTHHGEPIAGENRPLLDSRLGIYQYDDLIVLKEAGIPAVLLEAAVISDPDDDAVAQSTLYQRKIADAVAQTIRFVLTMP